LPHCNVTIVPFHLGDVGGEGARLVRVPQPTSNGSNGVVADEHTHVDGQTPILEASHRQRVTVAGRVHSMRVQPRAGVATLECTVNDGSGSMTIVFLGRREVPGLHSGARVIAEGVVGEHHGRLAMLNPRLELVAEPSVELPPSSH
jgi:RecG-like helicase